MSVPVLLSGSMFSGKSTLAALLRDRRGYVIISARETLRGLANEPLSTRSDLQTAGARIEEESAGRWLADAVSRVNSKTWAPVVVDAARTRRQVASVKEAFSSVVHVHMMAPLSVIRERFEKHPDDLVEPGSFDEAVAHPIEQEAMSLGDDADLVLNSADASPDELFASLASAVSKLT